MSNTLALYEVKREITARAHIHMATDFFIKRACITVVRPTFVARVSLKSTVAQSEKEMNEWLKGDLILTVNLAQTALLHVYRSFISHGIIHVEIFSDEIFEEVEYASGR